MTTLFGYGNEANTDLPQLEFISIREQLKKDKKVRFAFTRISFKDNAGKNEDKECFTLINDDKLVATTVYVTAHEESLFPESKTDGVRLGEALVRALKPQEKEITGQLLVELANKNEKGTLQISKVDLEDNKWAWNWTIKF